MKNRIVFISLFLSSTLLLFNSCNKKDKDAELDEQFKQHNEDASSYKTELDQADNDINNTFDNSSLGKKGGGWGGSPLCGVIIDTSQIINKIVIFNFDGVTPCFSPSRTRSGQIKVQLSKGNKWGDAGSELTQTFINYKVTKLSNNKSITFNGTKIFTNVNGNDWIKFVLGINNLRYKERAINFQVSFGGGLSAIWNSARDVEWHFVSKNSNPSIPYDHVQLTAKGDTAVGAYVNVDSWGTNRFGKTFYTYSNSNLVSNSYCGYGRFTSGELIHKVDNNLFTLSLGLDQNGNHSPYACAYGFKVSWDANGKMGSVILSY